jgi:hypothetical protein
LTTLCVANFFGVLPLPLFVPEQESRVVSWNDRRVSHSMRVLAVLLVACGPVGGLLIGLGAGGSTPRTVGFVLLGVFLLGGSVWTSGSSGERAHLARSAAAPPGDHYCSSSDEQQIDPVCGYAFSVCRRRSSGSIRRVVSKKPSDSEYGSEGHCRTSSEAGAVRLLRVDFVVVGAAVALPAVAGFFAQRVAPVVLGAVCLWLLVGLLDLERRNADLDFEGLAVLVVLAGLAGFAALGAFIGATARRRLRR